MYHILLLIIFQDPPVISVSPSMQTLRPGDHFLIQCTARGTEPIEIEWTKLYGSLSPSATEHRGVLEIASVTAADSGRYRCSASNDAGRAETLAELIILGKYPCESSVILMIIT